MPWSRRFPITLEEYLSNDCLYFFRSFAQCASSA